MLAVSESLLLQGVLALYVQWLHTAARARASERHW
jgi:hypothetical protein